MDQSVIELLDETVLEDAQDVVELLSDDDEVVITFEQRITSNGCHISASQKILMEHNYAIHASQEHQEFITINDESDDDDVLIINKERTPSLLASLLIAPTNKKTKFSENKQREKKGSHEPIVYVRNECSICFYELRDTSIVASPNVCSHIFCVECLEKWSKVSKSCPIDRKEFDCIHVKDRISGSFIKSIAI